MIEPMECSKCGGESNGMNPCPYDMDVNNAEEEDAMCDCCSDCSYECAMDI